MNSKIQLLLINSIGCIAFLSIPIISSPDFEYDLVKLFTIIPFQKNFFSYILVLLFFYLNYFYLIPKFYFNQNKILYAFFLIICLALYLILPNLVMPINFTDLVINPNFRNRPIHHKNNFDHYEFSGIISFGMVLCLSFLIKLNQHLKEIKTEKLNAEVSYLKAQINPHFLFNTLNSLYALTITKSDEAPNAVLKLSGIMRYVVTESARDFVSLEKEINYINDYIDLQKLRINDNLKFHFSVEGNIIGKTIAPLLLIPFIENAFKYGVNPEEDSEISITIKIDKFQLILNVKNKMAVDEIPDEFKTEKGIEITTRRLNFIYPNKHELKISENQNIYHIQLKLDLV